MMPIIPVDPSTVLVHHFLERSAHLYPDKVALIHGKVRATYAEINNRANKLAQYLMSIGAQKGDRVALLMENCLEYVISYYGIMKTGAVAVPLNSDLKPEGLRYAIGDLETKILISSSRFEKLIFSSNLSVLGLMHLIAKGLKTASLERNRSSQSFAVIDFDFITSFTSLVPSIFKLQPITPPDLASIIYTSGSTGGPKGVMLSHRNIVDNTFSICQYLHLTNADIQMCVLPFFYVMGKSLLNTHFAVGGTVIINNQFAFPATVIKEMIAEKVSGFSGVPSTFAYLVHRSPLAANRKALTSLRYVTQAGGHMSKAVKEKLRDILPSHAEIIVMYGATEAAARLSYLEPSRFNDRMDSIGTAIPGVVLKVIRENGREAAIGEVGELVASGSNIMQGYWKSPEATTKVLADGWYYTGDQAYMDEEGFFFLVGRKDDLIKVGGHRINPQEIEDVLMESGLFVEVMVLGIPDELLGNRLITLGVASGVGWDENQVLAYCANHMEKYKIPSDFRVVKNLPKKSSGKVDRKRCREVFENSFH